MQISKFQATERVLHTEGACHRASYR